MSGMLKGLDKLLTPANALVFVCACVILGAGIFYKVPQAPSIGEYNVEVEGKIVEYPDVRADKTILVIQPTKGGSDLPLGRVRVSADNLREFSYGEYIIARGTIKEPENFADFNWRGYLAKESVQYVMYYPEIQKTGKVEKGHLHYAADLRSKLQTGLDNTLLPPHNSLYSAMLLANKSGLSQEQKDSLASAGLSHIVAISGMHIAFILFMALGAFLVAGMWRQQANVLALLFITGYIVMIGAPASAVRAGIMAGVLILGQLIGRPSFSWRALLFAGALMVLFNPYIVRYDIGFQLSFLAVLGIILFFRRIEVFLRSVQKRVAEFVLRAPATKDNIAATYAAENKFGFISILAVTLSAQALTFPLIIYNFGSFSLASPATNLLVVPLLPAVLVSGFISAFGGMVGGVTASVLAAPAWIFSEYIWFIISTFS
ncbi:MAG: ComEC/Rec2 family competence protein [Candidatus Spechtbacterales bacterium]